MTNEKRNQTSRIEHEQAQAIFKDVKFILGTRHQNFSEGTFSSQECGPNCNSRLQSISCPFFKETVPCLVGSEVQQKLGIPGEGLGYEELSLKVVTQAGRYLIGEEVIINLDNPRATSLRLLITKSGNTVDAFADQSHSIMGNMEEGVLIGEIEVKSEQPKGNKSQSGR